MSQQDQTPDRAKKLLASLDEALVEKPLVSDKLIADVAKVREDIVTLCQDGRADEAERMAKLCLSMIAQGDAIKE